MAKHTTILQLSTCDLVAHFRARSIPEDEVRAFRTTGGYGYPHTKFGRFTGLLSKAGSPVHLVFVKSVPGDVTLPAGTCGMTCGIKDEPCRIRWWEFVVK